MSNECYIYSITVNETAVLMKCLHYQHILWYLPNLIALKGTSNGSWSLVLPVLLVYSTLHPFLCINFADISMTHIIREAYFCLALISSNIPARSACIIKFSSSRMRTFVVIVSKFRFEYGYTENAQRRFTSCCHSGVL